MQTVETIVYLEEYIKKKQLRYSVDDVDQFDHHVTGDEVIAVQFSTDKTANLCYEVLDADNTSGAVFSLCQHISVHLIDNVS